MPWSVILKDGSGVEDVKIRRIDRWADLPEKYQAGYSQAYARDLVFVGETRAGELWRSNSPGSRHRVQWTAISSAREPRGLRMVEGFGARRDAVTYLLRAGGWWD